VEYEALWKDHSGKRTLAKIQRNEFGTPVLNGVE
jgi:hypothetical protein